MKKLIDKKATYIFGFSETISENNPGLQTKPERSFYSLDDPRENT
jgi:hypothetical protein